MPATLDVRPTADLTFEQKESLALAARSLPDGWTVIVERMTGVEGLTLQLVGPNFATLSPFDREATPDQLAAAIERIRREKG